MLPARIVRLSAPGGRIVKPGGAGCAPSPRGMACSPVMKKSLEPSPAATTAMSVRPPPGSPGPPERLVRVIVLS